MTTKTTKAKGICSPIKTGEKTPADQIHVIRAPSDVESDT